MRRRASRKTSPKKSGIVRYTEGDGITVYHRIKIPIDAQHIEELKRRTGKINPASRNSVEDILFHRLQWARETLAAAGLPCEARNDGGFVGLEGLAREKGFKRRSSPEWYAAQLVEEVERITMILGRIDHREAHSVAYLALHLGYTVRERDEKFGSDIERSALAEGCNAGTETIGGR